MNKWLELLIGLLLVTGSIYVWGMNYLDLGTAALMVLKGGITWGALGMGALFLLLGISDLRE